MTMVSAIMMECQSDQVSTTETRLLVDMVKHWPLNGFVPAIQAHLGILTWLYVLLHIGLGFSLDNFVFESMIFPRHIL